MNDLESIDKIYLIIGGLVALWLFTRKWLWGICLMVGAIASACAALASIIHFQILAATGYVILAFLLYGFSIGFFKWWAESISQP